MTTLHAKTALTAGGWLRDVRLMLENGRIVRVEAGVAATPTDERLDVLLPAMPNLHSHAFQRAMAGLTEVRGMGDDSFWSWRTLMYRFALSMTPDQVEAVAAQLYMEMLEAGFGRVGEFHYLHHDKDGAAYANIAEMAERIAAAAAKTGIGLTLLPVFYAHSGFGGQAAGEGQRRFVNSTESFARLMEGAAKAVASLPKSRIGIAPHSLRAATIKEIAEILPLANGGPVHIHVAEQMREVEDCLAFSGARPVDYLMANAPVDRRWCLIHATHMTDAETRAMAKSGAVAGLCPVTEANLGDGIFPGADFLAAGGAFGVGSDSNVLIGLGDELRQLEYSQRLARRARNVIAPVNGSTGRALFDRALVGGSRALGDEAGIREGAPADLVSLDLSGYPWVTGDTVLDHLIFAGGPKPDSVWVNGVRQVKGGRHKFREGIEARFRATMQALLG
ncbi:formimidoylglutamate deiminase [Neorhizobium sp. Rsf11]|uniref:Formimidoylglutamate deiminase n=2 Tax=Neorhizobium TaxID=1525371 RepID=A0ABV0LZF7_9HYPH|nr:formimidoylglutamate deiminase [Neorhizobium petrolearium]MCC2611194.1 formimidoylglutamate deiminase [Neorhizobium petrolearium]WGI71220.1 formimidoylglutamate deiminase [Neorhizobium petrolearium]